MKVVYWKNGDYFYCINLNKVLAIDIGPGVGNEYMIAFKMATGNYFYSLPKPLSSKQIKRLLALLQSSFILDLDKVIKDLLKEGDESEQPSRDVD